LSRVFLTLSLQVDNALNEDSKLQFEQGCFGQLDGAVFSVLVAVSFDPFALYLCDNEA
jgi:hypothetical protein